MGAAVFALPHVAAARPTDLAGDWWVFYSAALVVAHGGNPYHQMVLLAAERRVMPGVPPPPAAANFAYLPIAAWLLVPLTRLPFWASFAVVAAATTAATVLAIGALARRLGWRHPVIPAIFAAVIWLAVWGDVLGQPDGWLLLALVGAVLLRLQGRGLAAGVLLTAAWWKPQLLLPATPLLAASCWPDRRCATGVITGFVAGSTCGLVVQLAALPGLLPSWWRYLHVFAVAVPRLQADLAGAVGLLADLPLGRRPTDVATGVPALVAASIGLLAAAALAAALARGRARSGRTEPEEVVTAVCAPLALWLLATPYDHLEDLLLLVPLVVVLVGRDGGRLARPGTWAVVLLLVILPYVETLLDGAANLAPLAVLAVCLAGVRLAWRWLGPANPQAAVGPLPTEGPAAEPGAAP